MSRPSQVGICTPLYPSAAAHRQIASNEWNGAASPANGARTIAGPLTIPAMAPPICREAKLAAKRRPSTSARLARSLRLAEKSWIMYFNGFAGPGATMTLRLSIENMDRLPDGGPLRVEVKGRGLDIGRDAHLDWTLPDPSRYVSSKHCEIRFRDGGYWLHDVSTNGTFVNGAQFRLDAPHLLRNGDRLSIGPYVIAVAIEGEAAAVASASSAAPAAGGARGCLGRGRRGGGARGSRRLSRAKAAGAGRRLSRFRLLRGSRGFAGRRIRDAGRRRRQLVARAAVAGPCAGAPARRALAAPARGRSRRRRTPRRRRPPRI